MDQEVLFVADIELAETLLVFLEVLLERADEALGVLGRRNHARANFGARRAGWEECEIEDKLVLGMIDDDQVRVDTQRHVLIDLELDTGLGSSGLVWVAHDACYDSISMDYRGKTLGLDVGSKTIGVAVSDELGIAAHSRTTIMRRGTGADVDAVSKLVRVEGVSQIVVGLPLTLEGEVGQRARRVLFFVEALRKGSTVPVETWDERFSTAGAERVLIEADLSRARRKEVIDKQAAAFILQGWLDAHGKPR